MKKTLLGILMCAVCLFSSHSVSAQTASSSAKISPKVSSAQSFIVGTVDIINAKIVSQTGRDFNLAFTIMNATGTQSEIRYAVVLSQVINKQEVTVDEKTYDDAVSLNQGASIQKTIQYTAPDFLPTGAYKLYVTSQSENGLPLATVYFGSVNITSGGSASLFIVPGSCTLSADGMKSTCSVKSTFTSNVTASPVFTTHVASLFGSIASTTGGSVASMTIQPGLNKIDFSLPRATAPQKYILAVSLNATNANSNTVWLSYEITGLSGLIQNVVLDKSFYQAGDTAHIRVFSTLSSSASSTQVTVSLSDGSGNACADPVTQSSGLFAVIDIAVPVTRSCMNPSAAITLSADGTTLDTKTFSAKTSGNIIGTESAQSASFVWYIVGIIIIVCILLALIPKKKKDLPTLS